MPNNNVHLTLAGLTLVGGLWSRLWCGAVCVVTVKQHVCSVARNCFYISFAQQSVYRHWRRCMNTIYYATQSYLHCGPQKVTL